MTDSTKKDDSIVKILDPLSVCFEVAANCNLNCAYCYRLNKAKKFEEVNLDSIKAETVISILNEIKNRYPSINIEICGPEPLTDYKNLISVLDALNLVREKIGGVRFLTNAILLSSEYAVEISQTFKGIETQISIDGPEKIHDTLRIYKANKDPSHRKVIAGLNNALNAGISVSLHSTISRLHLEIGAKIFYEYMQGLGVPWSTGKGDFDNPKYSISAVEFTEFLIDMLEIWAESENQHLPKWIDGLILMATEKINKLDINQCAEGMIVFAGSKGLAWPCDRLVPLKNFCLGSYSEDGIDRIINHPMRSKLSHLFHNHSTCGFVSLMRNGSLSPIEDVSSQYKYLYDHIQNLIN